jgi:hypothetical protein
MDKDPAPALFIATLQEPTGPVNLVLRAHGDPKMLAQTIQREIHAIEPDLPIANVRTMDDFVSASVAAPRFNTILLGVFSGLALLLATTGITAAIAAARLLGGWLIDRLPVPYVAASAQAIALFGAVALTVMPSPEVAILTLGLIGVGCGLISGVTAGAVASYWPKVEFGRIASRTYIAWCLTSMGERGTATRSGTRRNRVPRHWLQIEDSSEERQRPAMRQH